MYFNENLRLTYYGDEEAKKKEVIKMELDYKLSHKMNTTRNPYLSQERYNITTQ